MSSALVDVQCKSSICIDCSAEPTMVSPPQVLTKVECRNVLDP